MKRRYYFLFIGILILIGLLTAEVFLRLNTPQVIRSDSSETFFVESNPELLFKYDAQGKHPIPGVKVLLRNNRLSHRDILIRTNSMGFRGPEIGEKQKDEFRILVMGDSITWADYLLEDEIFHHQLSHLSEEIGRKVTVVNGGVGDIGLSQEMDILRERGIKISPDLVVVAFYLNDSRPPWGFPGEISHRGWLRRYSRVAELLYERLSLAKWMSKMGKSRFEWVEKVDELDWKNSRQEFLALAASARFDWGAAWQEDSWEKIERHFRGLRELSKKHKFEVMAMVLPVSFQVYSEFLENYPQRKIKEMGDRIGFPVLDVLPLLRNYRDKELFYDQCHPLPAANGLIGVVLKRFVYENFFVRPNEEKRDFDQ